jgi:hypothetical protein
MSGKQAEVAPSGSSKRIQGIVIPILVVLSLGVSALVIAMTRDSELPIPVAGQHGSDEPAEVVPIGETGFSRVILTNRAAERLGIETTTVKEEQIEGETRRLIPYSAVIYGLNGETWCYISLEPLAYVREPITVDFIADDRAYLTTGPSVGTEVVTIGVAELYGTETGVGK